MTHATLTARPAVLRPATDADIDPICTIWRRGWRDGHLGHVPAALLPHRRLGDFRALVPARLDRTTVATTELGVVGFVTWHDDEIEQLYVDAPARGTGLAATLLAHGETVIGERFDRAWLAVVAGNIRARRFYERSGWSDAGAFDNPAPTAGDATIPVPALRYEKRLTPALPDDHSRQSEGGRGAGR
jgi:GNAT superfamily N-acetyltransferase